jgi:hypothetical protein
MTERVSKGMEVLFTPKVLLTNYNIYSATEYESLYSYLLYIYSR